MDIEEFLESVEVEGLEYYLLHKTNAWHYLSHGPLLDACHEFVRQHNKIQAIIDSLPKE